MKEKRKALWMVVAAAAAGGFLMAAPASADICYVDDLIVDGSLCVGFDCVCNYSFGFDTIVLRENNLRIFFDDTSSSSSFPSRDWRIVINDSANGGASYFGVEDSTGGRRVFTLEAGAPSHSLFVDDGGRLGLGTSTPVVDIHAVSGNTPTLRLDQNGSSGFSPQSWDVAGNETNFFIRDVTNGSKLPFRIRPNAPTSSIDIAASGNVGVGTSSPDSAVHVLDSGGSGAVQLRLENNGAVRFELEDNTDTTWVFRNSGCAAPAGTANSCFRVNPVGVGSTTAFQLEEDGDLFLAGSVNPPSSRRIKEAFERIDPTAILERVLALQIEEWTYTRDAEKARHVGPMAEDFWAAFQLGPSDEVLSPSDAAGVALAAIQGLHDKVVAKDAELSRLYERLAALEALVATLSK